jgi:hypothetical protein
MEPSRRTFHQQLYNLISAHKYKYRPTFLTEGKWAVKTITGDKNGISM